MKDIENYESVLTFWFGEIKNGMANEDKKQLWYESSTETDKFIIAKFTELHKLAANGQLSSWQERSRSSLALIVVLDQFSRNMFRATKQAFAYDEQALMVCLNGIEAGLDKNLALIEKHFYYHPLMHAESIEHQERCVSLFRNMLNECNDDNRQMVENALGFAEQHRDIIAQFGRFPYRNAVLDRQLTELEMQYLNEGGNRFGQ